MSEWELGHEIEYDVSSHISHLTSDHWTGSNTEVELPLLVFELPLSKQGPYGGKECLEAIYKCFQNN